MAGGLILRRGSDAARGMAEHSPRKMGISGEQRSEWPGNCEAVSSLEGGGGEGEAGTSPSRKNDAPGPGNRFQLAKLPRPRTFLEVPFTSRGPGATDLAHPRRPPLSFVDFNWQNSRNASPVPVTVGRRRPTLSFPPPYQPIPPKIVAKSKAIEDRAENGGSFGRPAGVRSYSFEDPYFTVFTRYQGKLGNSISANSPFGFCGPPRIHRFDDLSSDSLRERAARSCVICNSRAGDEEFSRSLDVEIDSASVCPLFRDSMNSFIS